MLSADFIGQLLSQTLLILFPHRDPVITTMLSVKKLASVDELADLAWLDEVAEERATVGVKVRSVQVAQLLFVVVVH